MIRLKLPQAEANASRLVPIAIADKVQKASHNLNLIISVSYAAMVNSATYFIVEYLAHIRKLPVCRGLLKHYVNMTEDGMRRLERSFKYEFSNLDAWQRNLDLTDCLYEKIKPTCKGMQFALSNELEKIISETGDRDMLSNMIVGSILLRQATTLFKDVLGNAHKETMFDFRPSVRKVHRIPAWNGFHACSQGIRYRCCGIDIYRPSACRH